MTIIKDKLITLRGQIGMLDRDIAELFGMETKRLNEQLKRNQETFSETDIFILEKDEKTRIKKKLADRVFYPDTDTVKSPWNNINRAFMEIENLGAKLEDEGELEDLKFIYKIKDLLEKIENEFK